MARYHVRFVHKISPRDSDVSTAEIPGSAFADRKALASALRTAGVLAKGERVSSFRVEGDRLIVFPMSTVWHSVILTHDE